MRIKSVLCCLNETQLFIFQSNLTYLDFVGYFQIMAGMYLAGIIVFKTNTGSLMDFLHKQCEEIVVEKANLYNAMLDGLKKNFSVLEAPSDHYNSWVKDIEKLKTDAKAMMDYEANPFSARCICSFFFCLTMLVLAPIAIKCQQLYCFLIVFTFFLFAYVVLLRKCVGKGGRFIAFRSIIVLIAGIIAASTIISILICHYFPEAYLLFQKNYLILISVLCATWCFVNQFYLMMRVIPLCALKKHNVDFRQIKKEYAASLTLAKSKRKYAGSYSRITFS